jgi:hypothetical protein
MPIQQPSGLAPRRRAEPELDAVNADPERYPAIMRLWENAWAELVPFLSFDREIRTVICTTNAIESITVMPGSGGPSTPAATSHQLPTEQAALKCLYLAIMSLDPTGKGRQRWTNRWKAALNAFDITLRRSPVRGPAVEPTRSVTPETLDRPTLDPPPTRTDLGACEESRQSRNRAGQGRTCSAQRSLVARVKASRGKGIRPLMRV